MSPGELLDLAHDVLEHEDFELLGTWPRAVALLGRQSLETGLDELWDRSLPQMKTTSRWTQTACLDQFVRDAELSNGVREAWGSLSRACHHHQFELSPTASELERWLVR